MKSWTKQEEDTLLSLVKQGLTTDEIAQKLGRGYKSIQHRRAELTRNTTPTTRTEEDTEIKANTKKQLEQLAMDIAEKVYSNYIPIKIEDYKSSYNKKSNREEHSILDISDIHLGMINTVFDSEVRKNVTTYNHSIFLKELNVLTKSVLEIHKILSHSYKLRHLTINIMGDIVTNDRIFDSQVFEIEKVVGLQVWDAINYLNKLINILMTSYEKIDVVCVVGNHGRSLPDGYEEPIANNYEFFVYKSLEKQFENNKRVKIIVPDSRRYIHEIYGWKHMIEHGDSLKSFTPSGIANQVKDLSINVGGFHIFHYGHIHKLAEYEISDKVIVKQNGCWVHKDSYGFKNFKNYSIPKQWFFGCNEKRPETWQYKLNLLG